MTSVKKAFDSGAIPASQSEHLSYAEKFFGIQRYSSPCEAGVAPLSRPFFKPYMDTDRKLTNGIILSAELNQRLTA